MNTMTECKKDNILHVEIYTNTMGCGIHNPPAKYTISVYGEDGGMIKGSSMGGGSQDFVLPDGEYKITVQGDACASPRMQQKWVTLRGKRGENPEQYFAISFVFGRIYGNNFPDAPLDCNRQCAVKPSHPCVPPPSPYQPSYYVRDWERRNVRNAKKANVCPHCGKCHK